MESIDTFVASLRGELIRPGDPGYDDARHVWNGMIDRHPALIARCTNPADVIEAVNFARANNLLVAVRGGGHGVAGHATCDGGLVIDLSSMKGIHVDPRRRTARVQAGATWGDLDRETQVFGLAAPGGVVSTTGVAGLTLGGGFGWLRRKYGLSCDNLISVDVVTADGQLLRASERENADLFWGIRGGGGNFGVVTSFEFRLHPVGPLVMALATMYPIEEAARILPLWRDFIGNAPEELTSNTFFWTIPVTPLFPPALHGKGVFTLAGMYAGSVTDGERVIQPLRELGEPLVDLSGPMPYTMLQSFFDPFFPAQEGQYYWKSLNLSSLDDEVVTTLLNWAVDRPSPQTLIDIWAMGGAVSQVPADATAYGDRSAPFVLVFNTSWVDPEETHPNITWTRLFWDAMHCYSPGSSYLNFPGLGEEGDKLVRDSYGANYLRLVALKNKYDPTNLFRLNQNIKPTV